MVAITKGIEWVITPISFCNGMLKVDVTHM